MTVACFYFDGMSLFYKCDPEVKYPSLLSQQCTAKVFECCERGLCHYLITEHNLPYKQTKQKKVKLNKTKLK